MDLVPGPYSASTIASLEAVAVADITNPTELNSLAGTVVGERRVCYQVVANDNLYTVYFWDSADGAGASSPYVVAGSAGYWIAAGGRYTNSAVSMRSTLLVSGAVTLSSTLGAGASTLASLIVTGAATVGTTLGVTGLATLTAGLTTPAQITSTIATGTAPFVVASTTVVGNLNVSQLLGSTWAAPGSIGSGTPAAGAFTTLSATGTSTLVAVNASGDIACTSNNITLTRGTAGGTVISATNNDTTSSTSVEVNVVGTTTGGASRNAVRLVHQANLAGGNAAYLLQSGKVSAILFEDAATVINQREGGPLIFGVNDTERARLTGTGLIVAPGSTNSILLGTSSNYGFLSFNNSASFTAGVAIAGAGGSDNDMYFLVPTSRGFHWRTNNVETATLTSAGNLTTVGTFQSLEVIVSSGAANAALTLTTSVNGNQRYIKFVDSAGSKYNFQVGAQITVSDAWEIIPSTAAGGSTFSTPALYVNGATGTVRVPTTTDASDWVNAAFSTLGGVAMAKNLWVGSDSLAGCAMYLNCAAANGGFIKFNSASTLRWQMGRVGSTHDWRIEGYDSGGSLTDIPLTIANAAGGAFTIVRPVTLSTASSGLTISKTTGATLAVASTAASSSTTTGCATFAGGIGVAGRVTAGARITAVDELIVNGSTTGYFEINRSTAGGYAATFYRDTSNTKFNWVMGAQINVDDGFEFTPSTAAGGSTYSVPALSLNSAGAAVFTYRDAGTTNAPSAHTLRHKTSGTAAAGFGVQIAYQADTTTTANRDLCSIQGLWSVATDASRTGRLVLSVNDSAAARECMRMEASGSAPMVGLYGTGAVVQYATTGTSTGFTAGGGTTATSTSTFTGNTGSAAYTVGDIVRALKLIGLMAA